ncbi:MAG: 4Fe-4S binding protein [Clostridia bacterium]|nr:4Fe-4S binding protein [Clostridia bacterium]
MDNNLTIKVKELAYRLGADLVGVANIERYENAPIKMSPQGILPSAKSVIVCAVHHPDAAIELDGEVHPQEMGPYRIQYIMNDKLDVLSFKIARMLDDLGYQTVPIASSNIWRYRGYKEMDAVFAPDISHIYSGVCAGLGELGWNGLCITPEYGARNRFISIITEAELTPTPLYNGPKLCDMCGECVRKCPTNAYRKEVNGTKNVVVEGKDHIFANKNLWRCAWGEHFDLDLDLPIPEKVDEQVLLEHVAKHGIRGGEFGVCLKVCLPKHLRNWDTDYCKLTARRKRHVAPTDLAVHRQVYDKLLVHARTWDLDSVHFISQETLTATGIDIVKELPDGVSAILLTARYQIPKGANIDHDGSMKHIEAFDSCHKTRADAIDSYARIARFNVDFTELDICRELETLGYTALPKTTMDHAPFCELCNVAATENTFVRTALVLTSAPFVDRAVTELSAVAPAKDLKKQLKEIAKEKGADLFGVASAETVDRIAEQLREIRKGETQFVVEDKNIRMMPFDPVVTEVERGFTKPTDLIHDAKSVIVMGMHYPDTPATRVGKPPAESVGPYVFTQYEVNRLTGHLGYSICRALNAMGYEAVYSHNLIGAGSTVGSPRGQFNDAFCNAPEAVAAGIGKMGLNGSVVTEEYGIHQRFVAIVTNADLQADEVQEGLAAACVGCEQCLNACPTGALKKERLTELDIAGKKVTYLPVDAHRCDWATKFSLVKEEGNMFVGNFTDIPCPKIVTPKILEDALRLQDPVFKFRPVTGEKCVVSCPLHK